MIAACPANAECFIHIRLGYDDFPTAYSPSDAVGVWLAQVRAVARGCVARANASRARPKGNVGECLKSTPDSTFYSNDGGHNWVVMSPERVIFEVSNHGALVTGALTERPTNELVRFVFVSFARARAITSLCDWQTDLHGQRRRDV